MERNDLARKLELVGELFEIDGMENLLGKFEPKMGNVKFSAVVFQIAGSLLNNNRATADKLIALNRKITEEEAGKLDDAEYAEALRTAIIVDVFGFFGSSPRTDGRK